MKLIRSPSRLDYLFFFGVALLVLPFGIRSSSIWVDELQTFAVASIPGVEELCRTVFSSQGAIGGMPIFFILEWGWCKLFGFSEWAMRSVNLPFAAIYLLMAGLGFYRCRKLRPWLYVLFVVNPIFLYYLNEARPYIVLLAAGSIFTYILVFMKLDRLRNMVLLHLCFLVGFATHMMFGFIMVMYITMVCQRLFRGTLHVKPHLQAGGLFLLPNVLLLGYYLLTLSGANELGGVDSLESNSVASILQIGYYFLGFGGLALSRNDLRRLDFGMLTGTHLLAIALVGLGYLLVIRFLMRDRNRGGALAPVLQLAGPLMLSFLSFILANHVLATRFWERHVIYLVPGFLFCLAYVLNAMWTSRESLNRVGVLILLGCLSLSGFNVVLNDAYAKEDYKGVVKYLRSVPEMGGALLQGDCGVYAYYGLDVSDESGHQEYVLINNYTLEDVTALLDENTHPRVVVVSARREYDQYDLYSIPEADVLRLPGFRIVRMQ